MCQVSEKINLQCRFKRLGSYLLALWMVLIFSASFAESSTFKKPVDEQQASQILDYEILLLRAEIALRSKDTQAFNGYMLQLDGFIAPSQFQLRFNTLHQAWLQQNESKEHLRVQFKVAKEAKVTVILLPLSGRYSEAGQAVLEPLENALTNQKTYVIDTQLYDDMDELWALVNLFDPDLIVGPLLKSKAQALSQRNTHIPMMVFTTLDRKVKETPHILSMASAAEHYYKALQPLFKKVGYEEIAWLMDGSDSSNELKSLLEQGLQVYANPIQKEGELPYSPFLLDTQSLRNGVDKSLARLMGSEQSLERKNWLQRTINHPLKYEQYVRQDKRVLIIAMPQNYAVQVAPLVDYLHLDMTVLWLPTELPAAHKFQLNLASWQSTFTILPGYFVYQYTDFLESVDEKGEVGLFYALGDLAGHLIRLSGQPTPFRVKHELGEVEVDINGKYYLKPQTFKLDKEKMIPLSIQKTVR